MYTLRLRPFYFIEGSLSILRFINKYQNYIFWIFFLISYSIQQFRCNLQCIDFISMMLWVLWHFWYKLMKHYTIYVLKKSPRDFCRCLKQTVFEVCKLFIWIENNLFMTLLPNRGDNKHKTTNSFSGNFIKC